MLASSRAPSANELELIPITPALVRDDGFGGASVSHRGRDVSFAFQNHRADLSPSKAKRWAYQVPLLRRRRAAVGWRTPAHRVEQSWVRHLETRRSMSLVAEPMTCSTCPAGRTAGDQATWKLNRTWRGIPASDGGGPRVAAHGVGRSSSPTSRAAITSATCNRKPAKSSPRSVWRATSTASWCDAARAR
jgi:hypothetical protein